MRYSFVVFGSFRDAFVRAGGTASDVSVGSSVRSSLSGDFSVGHGQILRLSSPIIPYAHTSSHTNHPLLNVSLPATGDGGDYIALHRNPHNVFRALDINHRKCPR